MSAASEDGPKVRRLVVFTDSLALTTSSGPVEASDPRLYPRQLARFLEKGTGDRWDVETVGRAGLTVVELNRLLRDSSPADELSGADAVVVGVGSLDASTSGIPLRAVSAFRRYAPRRARTVLGGLFVKLNPIVTRLRRERSPQTPRPLYRASWANVVAEIRKATSDVALCGVLPAIHRARIGGSSIAHHQNCVDDTITVAAEVGVPVVDLPGILQGRLDELGEDGMHWSLELHRDVAEAMADALLPQLD
jgi:lysophospholipase L1-like esterase